MGCTEVRTRHGGLRLRDKGGVARWASPLSRVRTLAGCAAPTASKPPPTVIIAGTMTNRMSEASGATAIASAEPDSLSCI
jgi:hypothetical protein